MSEQTRDPVPPAIPSPGFVTALNLGRLPGSRFLTALDPLAMLAWDLASTSRITHALAGHERMFARRPEDPGAS